MSEHTNTYPMGLLGPAAPVGPTPPIADLHTLIAHLYTRLVEISLRADLLAARAGLCDRDAQTLANINAIADPGTVPAMMEWLASNNRSRFSS